MRSTCLLVAVVALGAGSVAVACREGEVAPTPFATVVGRAPTPAPPTAAGFDPGDDLLRCPGVDPPVVGTVCGHLTFRGTSSSGFATSSSSGASGAPKISPTPDDGTCEYGHNLDPSCNPLYSCIGTWARVQEPSCDDRCPSTIDDLVPGEECSDPSVGCSYVRGTCACLVDPVNGVDAGAKRSSHWLCVPPPGKGCPAQRPGLGSDCVQEMTCDYGSAVLRRDLTYACIGGRWLQADSVRTSP